MLNRRGPHLAVAWAIVAALAVGEAAEAVPVDVSISGNVIFLDDPDNTLSGILGLNLALGDPFSARYQIDSTVMTVDNGTFGLFRSFLYAGSLGEVELTLDGQTIVGEASDFAPGAANGFIQIGDAEALPNLLGAPVVDYWQIGENVNGAWPLANRPYTPAEIAAIGPLLNMAIYFMDADGTMVDAAESYLLNDSTSGWEQWGFVIAQHALQTNGQTQLVRQVAIGGFVNVPEPGVGLLLACGGAVLAACGRRTTGKSAG